MLVSINNINTSLIPAILNDSKFKTIRHAMLLFVIFIIASNVNVNGEYKHEYGLLCERILFFAVFVSIIYANMYVLVPRFLLKSRLIAYFLSVIILISLLLLLGLLSQLAFHIIDWDKGTYASFIFNLAYSILSIGLIVLCSSAFIILRSWITYNQRIRELETITLNAELQQLKNQINPHFLFNILNNVNIMVKHNPIIASKMLTKLDDLLSYQIEDSTKDTVLLTDDIRFLTDYLELEKSRRNRFKYAILKEGILDTIKVPPMLFIPFVENAVKHSSENKNTSYVDISFKIKNSQLLFICVNSKPQSPPAKAEGGLGLANIRRRLELLYKSDFSLKIHETDTLYTVALELKL